MARVATPSQEAVDAFKKAGMEDIRPHMLTTSERARVEAVLASLPSLNRHVLEKKLHYLAFVDGIPGEGTGLTSSVAKTGLYDITLRSSILDELLLTGYGNDSRRSGPFGDFADRPALRISMRLSFSITWIL